MLLIQIQIKKNTHYINIYNLQFKQNIIIFITILNTDDIKNILIK